MLSGLLHLDPGTLLGMSEAHLIATDDVLHRIIDAAATNESVPG